MRLFALAVVIATLAQTSVSAQSTRYSTWSDPSSPQAGNDVSPAFIEKLNKLIDDAEKAKAADPVFLRDLRALANGAATPWNAVVLNDSFDDGNFTTNPRWEVLSGEYFIETGWGLRNRLITEQQSQQQSSGNSGDDFAKALLGAVLKQATGGGSTSSTASGPTSNVIVTRVPISNAFKLELEMSSWQASSNFDVGVFQGANATVGYRVLYVSGKGLQLQRVGNSGSSVIATSEPVTLEDKAFHTLAMSRGADGNMRVSLDGAEVISTTDRAFSDPFDGVRISDSGGDFIIKRITATGL